MNNEYFTYKVKVKNGAGWRAFDTARIHISVGQQYHEGEKFKATVDWAKDRFERVIICVNDTLQRSTVDWAKDRFERVIICVNDTLQRHNMEEIMTPAEAFLAAEAAGREWIERNISQIRRLPRYEIKRWEEWRSHADYQDELDRMVNAYHNNPAFTRQVEEEVQAFWDRHKKHDPALSEDGFAAFRTHSTTYLLEECAAFQIMFCRNKGVDIYPGSTLLPCKISNISGLGDRGYTRIDFSRIEAASSAAQSMIR